MAESDVLQCLNLVYALLHHFIGQGNSLASVEILLRMLGLFVDKAHLLQADKVSPRSVASVLRVPKTHLCMQLRRVQSSWLTLPFFTSSRNSSSLLQQKCPKGF